MKRAIALFALFLGCIGLFAQESTVERLERELAEARAENAALRGQVPYRYETPERAPGQENVLGLRVAPIRNVRAAFIGCGARGGLFLRILSNFPDRVTIKAAADLYQEKLDAIDRELKEKGYPYEVFYTTDPDGWREICERDDIDMVFIATPPNLHLPIAVWAMEHGKHVAVEVPVVHNVQEAWKLVDTAERTRRHCVMLENCIYGDYELAIKNMVDLGLFGETIHAEGGYLHNLEEYRFDYDDKTNWRTERPTRERRVSGNSYPTHGLGPIAHWLGINRGDRMKTIVSAESADFTMRHAVNMLFGPKGDIPEGHFRPDKNLSIITTEKGRTMMLYYSTVLRQPYSRSYRLNGTRGFAEDHSQHNQSAKTCQRRLAFEPDFHSDLPASKVNALLRRYRHPIYERFAAEAERFGGHGGMDAVMIMRLVYCLNNGLPMDIDVYDGASWSSIAFASVKSVQLGGMPVEIPDFTRGDWKTLDGVKYYYLDEEGEMKAY